MQLFGWIEFDIRLDSIQPIFLLFVHDYTSRYDVTPFVTGYFSYKTPVKKAKLRTINVRPTPGGLLAILTKNGKFVGLYETKNLNFPNR